jgi:hypothetical protein
MDLYRIRIEVADDPGRLGRDPMVPAGGIITDWRRQHREGCSW